MPYSFSQHQPIQTISHSHMNAVQTAVEQMSADIYNVLEFGTAGDGTTNDTAAIEEAILATSAVGGVLYFPPGRTYLVDQIVGASGLVVQAYGATFQHTGGTAPLLTIDGNDRSLTIDRMVWRGGTLRAAQVAGATTACLYLKRAFYCEFSDIHIEAGDGSPTAVNRYADYGILIEGSQNNGTYWHNWYGIRVRGARLAGVRVDGHDVGTDLNHTGPNWWHGCRFIYNNLGFEIIGSNYEIFLGGQIEQNASYGLYLDYFAKDTDAYGLHLEWNNAPNTSQQIYVETRVPVGHATSQNARRNRIRGAIGGNPVNHAGDEMAAVRQLSLYENVGTIQYGTPPKATRGFDLQMEDDQQIALQTSVDGETYPRMRLVGHGGLQFRDPNSDTLTYFDAFRPAAFDQIITGANTVLRPRGGIRVGEGSTVKEIRRFIGTLDFPSIAAGSTAELTIAAAGAAVGDAVTMSPRSGIEAGLIWGGYVSVADTVTVRLANVTAQAIDPASRTWDVTWMDVT